MAGSNQAGSLVTSIIKKVRKFTSRTTAIEQLPVRAELYEFEASLNKLYPLLTTSSLVASDDSSETGCWIVVVLENSDTTTERLVELLATDQQGSAKQQKVEILIPSVKMMSAAVNQIHFESYRDHCLDLYCLQSIVHTSTDRQQYPCTRRTKARRGSGESVMCDCSSSRIDNRTPEQQNISPAKILEAHTTSESTLSEVARTLERISSFKAGSARKRSLPEEEQVASFDTAQEYVDCAAWVLEQACSDASRYARPHARPRTTSPRRVRSITADPVNCQVNDILPKHPGKRYFAIRAACCVRASLRPLDAEELFVATTTKVLDNDREWPFLGMSTKGGALELLSICSNFLQVENEAVTFIPERACAFTGENGLVTEADAQLFMALVCLKQISPHPRLILKPWLEYHKHVKQSALHRYVVTSWHVHCRRAEALSTKIPDMLHVVIRAAWTSEREARLLLTSSKLLVQGEALDVGLEVSIAHGFRELATSYRRMGARPVQDDGLGFEEWVFLDPLSKRRELSSTGADIEQ